MLAELENEIVDAVKNSALKPKLKAIESMPDLDGETLVRRFLTHAPGVYVAWTGFAAAEGRVKPRFGLAAVATNARGQKAARQGDLTAIGMQQIVDALAILMDGASTPSTSWRVTGANVMNDERFSKAGLYVAAVTIEGLVGLDKSADETMLDAFLKAYVNYDLAPADEVIEAEDRINLPQ